MTDNQIERAIMALGRDLHGMGDAEAVFRSWFNKSPEKREVERQVRLVLEAAAPAIPEGWVMVPVEPTREMLKAAGDYADECARLNYGGAPDAEGTWSAMLAARPLPTEEEGGA